ncbi:MAG: ferredoxin--NADP reductase [Betaproteobacteria bacterium]|nr:ferredoxin--NADP reductase [Betaproteobacteria bacterium]
MPYSEQQVTSVTPWSDKTFSFTTTRPADFHFENGEFVTIGLRLDNKLVARAYSLASANDADHLEFLSIHVPDGPLTSHLVHVRAGDSVWVNSKPTGSLTHRHVRPGRNLYMLATGTGLAPFMSLVLDPTLRATHENIILVHTVRTTPELAYRERLEAWAMAYPRLRYVPTVTREPFEQTARGADLFRSGALTARLDLPAPDPEFDSAMLCGNPDMIKEMTAYLKSAGWTLTNHQGIGNFTVEKAFVLQTT